MSALLLTADSAELFFPC